jgi:hypothetical protein
VRASAPRRRSDSPDARSGRLDVRIGQLGPVVGRQPRRDGHVVGKSSRGTQVYVRCSAEALQAGRIQSRV